MILDSGERTVHPNGFQRDMHEGKGRMDLLPWRAIMEVSKHSEEGAKKYGERNVDLGAPQKSLIDSAFRHLAKYHIGMDDENHLRACAWNILWALEQEVCRPELIQTYRDEMKGPQKSEPDENVRQMNEELDELSAKHPGAGYQSGIRRGIREAREIFEKYFVNIHTPNPGGVELNGESIQEEPWKYIKMTPDGGHSINPERRCVEMTCYYNTEGFCQSVTDLWNPDLGEQCPDFSED